jgi:cell division protein FtsL
MGEWGDKMDWINLIGIIAGIIAILGVIIWFVRFVMVVENNKKDISNLENKILELERKNYEIAYTVSELNKKENQFSIEGGK